MLFKSALILRNFLNFNLSQSNSIFWDSFLLVSFNLVKLCMSESSAIHCEPPVWKVGSYQEQPE